MSVLVTRPAPDFTAAAVMPDNSINENFSLSDYRGKYVVLFFYPLDFTFVCPSEIIAFSKRVDDTKYLLGSGLRCHRNRHCYVRGDAVFCW